MEWKGGIQEYLSLGYLYLLLLGVTSDTLYYSIIGINILSYSTILDVLLSPFIHLTKSLIFPVLIVLIILGIYLFRNRIVRLKNKASDGEISKSTESIKINDSYRWVVLAALAVFGAYTGLGIGSGIAREEKILKGNFTVDHKLTFAEGSIKEVYLLGNNTEYIFYVEKGGHHPVVAPIADNISTIEKLHSAD